MCNYIKYDHFPKGTYIFRQGQISKRFYGIIQGRISIRTRMTKNKEDIIKQNKSNEEIPQVADGLLIKFPDKPIITKNNFKYFTKSRRSAIAYKSVEPDPSEKENIQLTP